VRGDNLVRRVIHSSAVTTLALASLLCYVTGLTTDLHLHFDHALSGSSRVAAATEVSRPGPATGRSAPAPHHSPKKTPVNDCPVCLLLASMHAVTPDAQPTACFTEPFIQRVGSDRGCAPVITSLGLPPRRGPPASA
jgi:hypothetical protein